MLHVVDSVIDYTKLVDPSDPMIHRRMDAFDFQKDDARLISKILKQALLHHGAQGIAANQMGLPYRAFAMLINEQPMVFFNPIITELSPDTVAMVEGCLTYQGKELKIRRPKTCRINFSDEKGLRQTLLLSGVEARCALHETDHLNGVTFVSKVSYPLLELNILGFVQKNS